MNVDLPSGGARSPLPVCGERTEVRGHVENAVRQIYPSAQIDPSPPSSPLAKGEATATRQLRLTVFIHRRREVKHFEQS